MTRKRTFTAASSPKTTAHELATELASFAASLKETAAELGKEIDGIEENRAEIIEERDAAIATFVETTVSDINSDQLEILSDLAAKDDEVSGQSLSFQRNEMVKERDAALQAVNGALDGVTDAEGVQKAVAAAQAKYEDAADTLRQAESANQLAGKADQAWKKTVEYKFIALSEEIQKKGGQALTQDNRAYYEPKDIFTAAYRYLTRDTQYRQTRQALVAYGHEEDGKDVFAEMANFRAKTEALAKDVNDTAAVRNTASEAMLTAQSTLTNLDAMDDDIKTDAQILETLRTQLAEYLTVPSYLNAVSAQYAEDFPQSVPLLSAKVNVLEKLRAGAQEKLEAIQANILTVLKQQTEVAKMNARTELNVDIEEVRRQNGARRAEYDNYTTATRESWNRTRSYDRFPDSVVVDRSSPSILEWILISHMLNDHNDRPTSTSSYTTDMLKLDRKEAVEHGVSDKVFDVSPEVARKMEDFGIQHYEKTGTFSFSVDDKASDYVTSHVDEAVRDAVREAVRSNDNFSFDATPSRPTPRSEPAREEVRSAPSSRHS